MFENIDEEFKGSLLSCIEYVKRNNGNYLSSSVLILSFIHFDDSIFNELLDNISFDEVFEMIINDDSQVKDLELILEEANKISKSSGASEIYDEYILSACLKLDCSARRLLFSLNIDVETLKININNYINNDNAFLTNLTKQAIDGKLNPFIGRKSYIDKIIRILCKKQKNNCILVGSAGVGKSALVEGLAIELYKNKSDIIIYRLDLGVIIAGTRYRGDLEERLVEVIERIKETNAVLFIDEIHTIISSGNSEGSLDIANILKPALARSEIKCIGATTTDEYYKYIEKDKALERRFEKIFIPEASKQETFAILKGISSKFSEYYQLKYDKKILEDIINYCDFFPNLHFPDKAIDIMDEVSVYVKKEGRKKITTLDIKRIVFENMGISLKKTNYNLLNYKDLSRYYELFFLGINARNTICNIGIEEKNLEYLYSDLNNIFAVNNESIYYADFNQHNMWENVNLHVLKNPISVVVFKYEKDIVREILHEIVKNNRKISFKNAVIIFYFSSEKKNLFTKIGYSCEESINYYDQYLDVVITDSPKTKDKINCLISSLRKNKYYLNISNDIYDSDYDAVINKLSDCLKVKELNIIKNGENEIEIMKKNII